ncbi:Periplasmic serine proteases (ClpP class) [Methanocella conradii HZ254]|uniref:Periplasmic serine proteases (ClpP class) n=2 Tax=Methanocella TaxID=570266 RepID=H8I630_METCZ|nr:Periplasmic serine proteases (ClpP class) [Methanocella conradii HZ254]
MVNEHQPIYNIVMDEQNQSHKTRQALFVKLEEEFGLPIVSYFTSFRYPAMIDSADADILEGVLQKLDLSKGFALIINSPGGDGLAAERIINVCRSYSGTKEFISIVPGKAKSAATMICFGSSKIVMGPTSELGPIDPQVTIPENDGLKRFSAYNIIESYKNLFKKAVEEKGNIQPYLQQLANYDEREIRELECAVSLSKSISAKTLASGMMKGQSENDIYEKIKIFLSPEHTKTHGRPIYRDEAKSCGLNIEYKDIKDSSWKLIYELYIRTNNFVSTKAQKCIESKNHSYIVLPQPQRFPAR